MEPIGGIINVQIDGVNLRARGEWTYGLGIPKNEAVEDINGIRGFKNSAQVAFVEGEITDAREFDHISFASITDATITLKLANGKVLVWREAWHAGESVGNTGEGTIGCRFESAGRAEVIK
ncbi:MAG: phage tail protein [Planctomycetota bacterium]|nr:MAG: phage tail protein [Planctomycetota bacterium]